MIKNPARYMVAVFLLLACFASLGCTSTEEAARSIENAEISLEEVEVKAVTQEIIELVITVNVYNPNNVTIDLVRLDYTIYANDERIGTGSFAESATFSDPASIPPEVGRNVSTTFIAEAEKLSSETLDAIGEEGEEVSWTVEGSMFFNTPEGTIEQTFSEEIQREDKT